MPPGREQAVAGQEVAGVLVGDREGIAVDPIAGPEVALEVGGPEVVGLRRRGGNDPGVLIVAPAAPFLDEPAARQEVPGGTAGGPVQSGPPRPEPRQELGGAPARMLPPGRVDHRCHLLGDAVRALVRRAAPIPEALPAGVLEAREPLVAGLATDAVPGAELEHGVQVQPVIANEPFTLFHGGCLQPGHRPTSCWPTTLLVSPMFPVWCVTYVPGLYRRRA